MFVTHEENLQRAINLWQGKPSGSLMWNLDTDGERLFKLAYYETYSLEHMRKFADFAQQANCRSLVHMCGLLHDLMPLIKQTGMKGIHALSPPTIGDTPFEYAYGIMPSDFFTLGRFGSLNWVGKTREDIMASLASTLPHHIYQQHAFMLLVTSDGADYTLDNLYLLRDCINEYEQITNYIRKGLK